MIEAENKIDALMKAVTVESNLLSNSSWRAIINLNDNLVEIKPDSDDFPRDCRTTCGVYGLKYLPATDGRRNPRFPYVFINDLLPMRICVSGMKHLACLSREIPEIAWILRNSNFNPRLFYWCARHPGLKIPFSVNFAEYCNKLEAKAKAQGINTEKNTDFIPLVNYARSKVKMSELFGNKKEWVVRPTAYSKQLREGMDKFVNGD